MFGVLVAFGLAGLAVVLISFGTTHKQSELGVIAGLWSALLGYLAIYGVRHHSSGSAAAPEAAPALPASGGELELAGSREVETTRNAEARREYEERLQALVQAEIAKLSDTMTSELHSLRDQVSQLRGELVDQVGGQLRLERVETTRVIGSNIEALQHEVRRLVVGRDDLSASAFGHQRPVEIAVALPEQLRPEPVRVEPARPEPVSAEPIHAVHAVHAVHTVHAVHAVDTTPAAATKSPPEPARVARAEPEPEPAAAVQFDSDPFAGLPRLTRFTDDDVASSETRELPTVSDGRRRRHRHSAEDEVATAEPDQSGGRRRRADNEPNDILQRLLASRP